MLLQLWSNWTKIFLGWKFLKDCCSLWIFKAIYVSVMEMSHVPLMYFLVYVLCSNAQKQDSFLTEMFTVWVSAEDWEMLEMSAVVSAACPDLSWARHWGNPDNAWPRTWLLNPWHLLVTSYNLQLLRQLQCNRTAHHSTGSNPDSLQSSVLLHHTI